MFKPLALAGLLMGLSAQAAPTQLTVATWNLGWHLDQELATQWRAACDAPFALDAKDGRWKPAASASADTRPGWALPWGRNAPVEWDIGALPPCDIYQVNRTALPVTRPADLLRRARLSELLRTRLNADVLAFQEVSGAAAIRELVGPEYEVCSYEGHKVQRLAFAWKRSLGAGRCQVDWGLSLPQRPMVDQVRPGLALHLQVDGRRVSFLTVHLKSSCVSPLDGSNPQFPAPASEARGQLDGPNPHCQSLQQQVAPLETWLDGQKADALVLLGDFNRNLGHEQSAPAEHSARVQGQATEPHGPGVKVRNLWRELNDGQPRSLTLLESHCEGQPSCLLAKSGHLDRQQYGGLRAALGCRNPVGLDHIVIAGALKGSTARKISMGELGDTRMVNGVAELGLSDHCPLAATVELK